MRRLIETHNNKKYAVIQFHTQAGNITTNIKVEIYFTLPDLSMTKIMMWNFHVYDSTKVRYNMILGRNILTALGLNLKLSPHVIKADNGHLKGSTAPMVGMGTYEFKILNTG